MIEIALHLGPGEELFGQREHPTRLLLFTVGNQNVVKPVEAQTVQRFKRLRSDVGQNMFQQRRNGDFRTPPADQQ